MTARELVTNLAENSLIIGKKYDVSQKCPKMPQNILFLRLMLLKTKVIGRYLLSEIFQFMLNYFNDK